MNIHKLIKDNRNQILATAAKYQASNVRVFGSCARNEADEKSDLDILVRLNTQKTGFAYFRILDDLQDELQSLLHIKVDVVDEGGLKPKIRERVLREAVSL